MKTIRNLFLSGFLILSNSIYGYEDLELDPPDVAFYLDSSFAKADLKDFSPYPSGTSSGFALAFGFTIGSTPDAKWAIEGTFSRFDTLNEISAVPLEANSPDLIRGRNGIPADAENISGIRTTESLSHVGSFGAGARYVFFKMDSTSLYSRAGIHLWDTDLTAVPKHIIVYDGGGTGLIKPKNVDSKTGLSFYYAAGIEYRLGKKYGVFVEYNVMDYKNHTVPFSNIGIKYRFNQK